LWLVQDRIWEVYFSWVFNVVKHADAFSSAFLQPCAVISWAVFGRGARLLSYRDLVLTFGIFVLTNDANFLNPALYEVSDNVDVSGLIK
jgi:hypothetical protein